jgi:hypothetical protein
MAIQPAGQVKLEKRKLNINVEKFVEECFTKDRLKVA